MIRDGRLRVAVSCQMISMRRRLSLGNSTVPGAVSPSPSSIRVVSTCASPNRSRSSASLLLSDTAPVPAPGASSHSSEPEPARGLSVVVAAPRSLVRHPNTETMAANRNRRIVASPGFAALKSEPSRCCPESGCCLHGAAAAPASVSQQWQDQHRMGHRGEKAAETKSRHRLAASGYSAADRATKWLHNQRLTGRLSGKQEVAYDWQSRVNQRAEH